MMMMMMMMMMMNVSSWLSASCLWLSLAVPVDPLSVHLRAAELSL
jgi:hypothetical protein